MAKFGVYSVLALLACLGLQAAAQTTLDGPTSIEFFVPEVLPPGQSCDLADRIDNLCQGGIVEPSIEDFILIQEVLRE
jgi:hypothetical protein